MAIFLFSLICLVIFIRLLIRLSYLKINILEFELLNKEIKKFKVRISLNLFNKFKWLWITLDNKKIQELKNSKRQKLVNEILKTRVLKDYKDLKNVIIKNWKKVLSKDRIFDIESLKLDSKIGTTDAALTGYIVGYIYFLIGILFPKKKSKNTYMIHPVYKDENYIYLSINCILSIKLVHIININKKKKREEVYQ